MEPTALEAELGSLREAMKALMERWNGDEVAASSRGFRLVHVAEGYAFRSSPEFSDIVRAMREQQHLDAFIEACDGSPLDCCLSTARYKRRG